MRRVGALINFAADDNVATVRNAAFLQGLERAGWTVGRNLRMGIAGPGEAPMRSVSTPRNWSLLRRT